MILGSYRGKSIRTRIFFGFMIVSILSIIGVTSISYLILKKAAENQNRKDLLNTVEKLIASLDYAVSHTTVTGENITIILENKILEISDISKQDIILYDLSGKYILSNKNQNLIAQQEIPEPILKEILKSDKRYDFVEYDGKIKGNVTSSYIKLLNNMLEPVAIVYFPFYHNDNAYFDVFNKYIEILVAANIIIIAFGIGLSWRISYELTRNIRQISDQITKINLNEKLEPIKYYNDDEFTPLINSYNRTLYIIDEQKELLSFREKESAWREMAKQVAHEVKNPLTPMKLLVQNFERKFDKNAPDIEDKVSKLCVSLVDQIDLIAKVANAFSEFTQLPEKKNEVINVNNEIKSLIRVFDKKHEIHFQADRENILINFDKIFFQRIMTNLILNAQQAEDEGRKLSINIVLELLNKKISIIVEDNGVGIPKEKLEKIFEPNFTTKTSGTGLGLTMVKRMIEDYKGEISIRSQEKRGTKVFVILPVNM